MQHVLQLVERKKEKQNKNLTNNKIIIFHNRTVFTLVINCFQNCFKSFCLCVCMHARACVCFVLNQNKTTTTKRNFIKCKETALITFFQEWNIKGTVILINWLCVSVCFYFDLSVLVFKLKNPNITTKATQIDEDIKLAIHID